MTPACLLENMGLLARSVSFGLPPADQRRRVVADWTILLADLDDETLTRAVVAYLRDPERGRHWPAPADLIAAAGAIAPPTPARLAEATWAAMICRIEQGTHRDPRTGAIRVGDLLTPSEMVALSSIGGTSAIAMAQSGADLSTLRRRWLERVEDAEQGKVLRLVAPAEDRAVTDRLRGLLGTGADEHAGQRARAIAARMGE